MNRFCGVSFFLLFVVSVLADTECCPETPFVCTTSVRTPSQITMPCFVSFDAETSFWESHYMKYVTYAPFYDEYGYWKLPIVDVSLYKPRRIVPYGRIHGHRSVCPPDPDYNRIAHQYMARVHIRRDGTSVGIAFWDGSWHDLKLDPAGVVLHRIAEQCAQGTAISNAESALDLDLLETDDYINCTELDITQYFGAIQLLDIQCPACTTPRYRCNKTTGAPAGSYCETVKCTQ